MNKQESQVTQTITLIRNAEKYAKFKHKNEYIIPIIIIYYDCFRYTKITQIKLN